MAASQLHRKVMREVNLKIEGDHCVISRGKMPKLTEEEAEVKVEMGVEPRTGVSFPVKLQDSRQLHCIGLRRKKVMLVGINIYAFGIYADNAQLKKLLRSNFGEASKMPMREVYEAVINSDEPIMVRMVIVFGALTMGRVRKNIDEGLGGSLRKLNGGRNSDELTWKILGAAKDSLRLPPGSVIEISRHPGYVLETKVRDELVSKVESELLCRAYFEMYLGDDAFDKHAKERFGRSLLSFH